MKRDYETCPDCGKDGKLSERIVSHKFVWGSKDDPRHKELKVRIPVVRCKACKLKWYDWRAEEIREKAVQDYLKTL